MALRPTPMARVVLTGLKADRDRILSYLHDQGVLQVEPIGKEGLEALLPERAGPVDREVLEQQSRIRALVQALPPVPVSGRERFRDVGELLAAARAIPIDEEVRQAKRREDLLLTDVRAAEEELSLVRGYAFFGGDLSLLRAQSVRSYFGEGAPDAFESFRSELGSARFEFLLETQPEEKTTRFVLSVPRERAELASRSAQRTGVHLVPVPEDLDGTPAVLAPRLERRLSELRQELAQVRAGLAGLSRQWYGKLLPVEEQLNVEARKSELIARMGGNRDVFAVEGWTPRDQLPVLEAGLERLTGGKSLVLVVPTKEEPPTLLRNRPLPRIYEFFIRFYSLPQSGEIDPTMVFAVVFPIFFGVMLGDVGYGLFILGVCLWLIWRVGNPRAGRTWVPQSLVRFTSMIMPPSAMKQLAKALLPGCFVAIGLGVVFDSYFGFTLGQLTFGRLNFQLFDPLSSTGVSKLILYTGYAGLAMVTLGFLFSFLNEIYEGHRKGAVAKVLWIGLAWVIALGGLALIHQQIVISPPNSTLFIYLGIGLALLVGVIVLESGQAAIEVMSVMGHIVSYTRLAGILLASVILATVVNQISVGLLHSGLLAIAGLVILVVGQGFNIVLGVFEPGIQGARLIYVEYFSKFYHGGGKGFHPFGGKREYTLAQYPAPGPPPHP